MNRVRHQSNESSRPDGCLKPQFVQTSVIDSNVVGYFMPVKWESHERYGKLRPQCCWSTRQRMMGEAGLSFSHALLSESADSSKRRMSQIWLRSHLDITDCSDEFSCEFGSAAQNNPVIESITKLLWICNTQIYSLMSIWLTYKFSLRWISIRSTVSINSERYCRTERRQ
jgi:hypothetical protein